MVTLPVGAAGVPPQLQVVLACAGADAAEKAHAATRAVTPMVGRSLILDLLFVVCTRV
jgi:hypothetical protein